MKAKQQRHIFLIPGFFGFANLGDFTYWGPVIKELENQLADLGAPARIHCVQSRPTASLRARTRCLLEAIRDTRPGPDATIHLIGHSTGGLDARLLLTPAVDLATRIDAERYASMVRSTVSVATPHRGAPIASFFTGLLGRKLLQLLSAMTIAALRQEQLPLTMWTRAAGLFAVPATMNSSGNSLATQLYRDLLADFDAQRLEQVNALLADVEKDQSLLTQLTVESMDLFNASAGNREGVAYGSVVTMAREPSFARAVEIGFDASEQAQHALYLSLSRLASGYEFAKPGKQYNKGFKQSLGKIPDSAANDGIVPTRSQPWGECVAVALADHLDIIGHFSDAQGADHHYDWLKTHSNFRQSAFQQLWGQVASFMLASETT